jgi:hypothetical protein
VPGDGFAGDAAAVNLGFFISAVPERAFKIKAFRHDALASSPYAVT